jgi:hypothetical protein
MYRSMVRLIENLRLFFVMYACMCEHSYIQYHVFRCIYIYIYIYIYIHTYISPYMPTYLDNRIHAHIKSSPEPQHPGSGQSKSLIFAELQSLDQQIFDVCYRILMIAVCMLYVWCILVIYCIVLSFMCTCMNVCIYMYRYCAAHIMDMYHVLKYQALRRSGIIYTYEVLRY